MSDASEDIAREAVNFMKENGCVWDHRRSVLVIKRNPASAVKDAIPRMSLNFETKS
jgi:hypothetical protein